MGWLLLVTCLCICFSAPGHCWLPSLRSNESAAESGVIPSIANGRFARPAQFPYMAALFQNAPSPVLCGGSIVSPWVVLTAAHCLFNSFGSEDVPKQVMIGTTDLRDRQAIKRKVVKAYVHPGFDYFNISSTDVALLQLNRQVKGVPFAELAKPSLVLAKREKLRVAGFGKTERQAAPKKLRYTTLSHVRPQPCKNYYGQVQVEITPYMICAGSKRTSDVCFGDSGGPLVTRGKNPVQVGIAAFGESKCGVRGTIGVYTSVSAVSSWVELQLPKIARRGRRRRRKEVRRRRRRARMARRA